MQWIRVRDESMEGSEEMGSGCALGINRDLGRRETKGEEKQRHG